MMNILVLTPFLPCLGKHGGSAQMFNLWSKMQDVDDLYVHVLSYQTELEEGCEISTSDVFKSIDIVPTRLPEQWLLADYLPDSDRVIMDLTFLTKDYKNRLIELLKSRVWDVVVIEMQFMMHFGEIVKQYSGSKIGLVVHESMEQRYKNDSMMLDDFLRYEKCYEKNIDFLICFSEEDKRSVEHYNKQTYTLPLCVDVDNLISVNRDKSTLMFLGSYNHQPNVDAVDYLLNEIMPLVKSSYNLKIFGAQLNDDLRKRWRDYPNVELIGFVDNALLAMAQCHVFVAPIISGKGVRTKIVEALSQNTAVVTTPLGIEGIKAEPNVDCLVADTAEKFSSAIDCVLKGEIVVGENAKNKVFQHRPHNVAKIMSQLLKESQV